MEHDIDRQIARVLQRAGNRRSIEAYQKKILQTLPGPEPVTYHDERLAPGDMLFGPGGSYALRKPSKRAK